MSIPSGMTVPVSVPVFVSVTSGMLVMILSFVGTFDVRGMYRSPAAEPAAGIRLVGRVLRLRSVSAVLVSPA
jgi:hypothetical protein